MIKYYKLYLNDILKFFEYYRKDVRSRKNIKKNIENIIIEYEHLTTKLNCSFPDYIRDYLKEIEFKVESGYMKDLKINNIDFTERLLLHLNKDICKFLDIEESDDSDESSDDSDECSDSENE